MKAILILSLLAFGISAFGQVGGGVGPGTPSAALSNSELSQIIQVQGASDLFGKYAFDIDSFILDSSFNSKLQKPEVYLNGIEFANANCETLDKKGNTNSWSSDTSLSFSIAAAMHEQDLFESNTELIEDLASTKCTVKDFSGSSFDLISIAAKADHSIVRPTNTIPLTDYSKALMKSGNSPRDWGPAVEDLFNHPAFTGADLINALD